MEALRIDRIQLCADCWHSTAMDKIPKHIARQMRACKATSHFNDCEWARIISSSACSIWHFSAHRHRCFPNCLIQHVAHDYPSKHSGYNCGSFHDDHKSVKNCRIHRIFFMKFNECLLSDTLTMNLDKLTWIHQMHRRNCIYRNFLHFLWFYENCSFSIHRQYRDIRMIPSWPFVRVLSSKAANKYVCCCPLKFWSWFNGWQPACSLCDSHAYWLSRLYFIRSAVAVCVACRHFQLVYNVIRFALFSTVWRKVWRVNV